MTLHLPKATVSRTLQREAEKIFESLLASESWNDVKIPQEKDYGLDYRVEYIRDGLVTGCEFYAQIKGFNTIADPRDIRIRAKASTVRYWQSKILPILLVAVDCNQRRAFMEWLDKAVEVPSDRSSLTLHFANPLDLTHSRLEKSLAAYYHAFSDEFFTSKRYSFYRQLYNMSVAGLQLVTRTAIGLLFDEHRGAKERNEHWVGLYYFSALSVLIHDAKLEQLDVDLGKNPIDQSINRLLERLVTIQRDLVVKRRDTGSVTNYTIKLDVARASLPYVASVFSELAWFLHDRFLSRKERKAQAGFEAWLSVPG